MGVLVSFLLSPNMNLPVPGVGTEAGPDYAFDINNCLSLIDSHDHTPGRGVQITPAAININTDLSFNNFSATSLNTVVFQPQGSASTTPQSLSVAPGGESPPQQDLWFTPNTGLPIQITKNGIVNVVASSIPGESYAAGTFFWTQTQDGFPNRPANFDIGSITIRPNVDLTTFGVTISPNAGISSQYNFVLPLLPVSTSFLTIDSSGNVSATPTTASFLPNNAGTIGQFYRQTAPGGPPTWANIYSNMQTKTTNYTLSSADDGVYCSTNPFTVTLPTAVGIAGKVFEIIKTDVALANIITIATTSAQTIGEYSGVSANTQDESWILVSDGANWKIQSHTYPEQWSSNETITIGAVTTAPVKGTIVKDQVRYKRQGRFAVIEYVYQQSTTGAGTSGSGDYLPSLPAGLVADTSVLPVYSTISGTAVVEQSLAYSSFMPTTAHLTTSNGTTAMYDVVACLYSSTQFRVSGLVITGSTTITTTSQWRSNQINLSGSNIGIYISITVPISGWIG